MNSALVWAGYEVNHIWGEGAHNSEHAVKIIRSALTWLWDGYPNPVTTHLDKYRGLSLTKDQVSWKLINTPSQYVDRMASNTKGEVYYTARDKNGIYKLLPDGTSQSTPYNSNYSEFAFDANDNIILAGKNATTISKIDKNNNSILLVSKANSDKMESSPLGIYFNDKNKNRISFYSYSTKKVTHFPTLKKIHGLALNAEQTFLNVMEDESVFGSSYKIKHDGTLDYAQSFIHFHIPYGHTHAEVRSAVIDTANLLYTATNMGVQVSDQLGRVNLILPAPGTFVSDICFGNTELNELYIISNGKMYKRRLNTKGKQSMHKASKPPRPGM